MRRGEGDLFCDEEVTVGMEKPNKTLRGCHEIMGLVEEKAVLGIGDAECM